MPPLSNTVEQIRPVNGLTRLVRLLRPVQIVKQWFTSRTIGELHRYLHTDDEHDAKHDEYSSFSKRESPKVPLMICSSQTVRLVNHCFTTCASRTTRKPLFYDTYESYESWTCMYILSLSNDIHFTNFTTRKPIFHDPYESYDS